MVGKIGLCDDHHTSGALWKNTEYEYAGYFFSIKYACEGELFEGKKVLIGERLR